MVGTSCSPAVSLEQITGQDRIAALQAVLLDSPDYYMSVRGGQASEVEAQSLLLVLPPGKTHKDKYVYGIYLEDNMVGCIDVIRRYPNQETAMIGLFLVAEAYQRRGIGTEAYFALEKILKSWGEVEVIRIGVVGSHQAALDFWRKVGFQANGEVRPYRYKDIEEVVQILTKPL